MAAVADYGTADPEKGVYGIYNPFGVLITSNTGGTIYKLKYRIKTTLIVGATPSTPSFERDVEPESATNSIAINPVSIMRTAYFKTQTVGDLGGENIDVSTNTEALNNAYAKIRVEIGEVYANAATDPPTFRGYDTSDTFYFYNGYDEIDRDVASAAYTNYRDSGWYDDTTIKLPTVIKNKKISGDSTNWNKFQFFQEIVMQNQSYGASNLITINYISGVAQTPISTSITGVFTTASLGSVDGIDYIDPAFDKVEQYIEYAGDVSGTRDSEKITFTAQECTKNERYRIRYFNRYGAFEYINFVGKTVKNQNIERGKLIDNSDFTQAASFSGIKPLADPDTIPYGDKVSEIWTLNSGYLTQEETEALKDLYKSRNTVLFDIDNNIIPVTVLDSTFKIVNVIDELSQVSVRFRLANTQKIQIQ